jgi:uncharacterized protein YjbI with pentapeptide repeats
MAAQEQLAILKQPYPFQRWSAWRRKNPGVRPDLCLANLRGLDLSWLDFSRADFVAADLQGASLFGASLDGANFRGADLHGVDLGKALLERACLDRARFGGAVLYETKLVNLDLSRCKGLESCVHQGPSIIDHRTLQRSDPLPLAFLRGLGLSDSLIACLSGPPNEPLELRSGFLRYSSKDQTFAERLHADLQTRGVRCWFAPQEMPVGGRILDAVSEAIRLREKLLLVLSERALASDWVGSDVTQSLCMEQASEERFLLPIRLDDAVLESEESWARLLRDQGRIGDFTGWRDQDTYSSALERLLRELKGAPPSGFEPV